MKIQIRRGLFETNSSSTHCLCICRREDYEKWKNDQDLIFDSVKDSLISKQDLPPWYEKDHARGKCTRYQTYKEYLAYIRRYISGEEFKQDFKDTAGEDMVAFGYYGRC